MSAEKVTSGPTAKGAPTDRPHGSKGGAFHAGHFARDSRSSRVVVVGLIGKSRFGKAAVANALLDRPGFRVCVIFHLFRYFCAKIPYWL